VNKKDTNNNKWISFTYVGKETKFLTKLFTNTKINISYKTKNTTDKLLTYKQQECIDKCNGKGIYALKVPDCGKRYLGQTDRSFNTRFKEHLQSYKHQNENSKFVQHLQEYHHSFGLTEGVNDSSPSCQEKKLYECSGNVFIYGYKETNLNNQLYDKSTLGYNKIFESGI